MNKHLYWLSFCDASRPKGSRFLGCAIVPGLDFVDACRCAHAIGCNPGGARFEREFAPELPN